MLKIVAICTVALVVACSPRVALHPEGGLDLEPYAGKVVYLDFWASWCEPCRRSFTWMSEMHERYGKEGLVIVAVNVDRDRASADAFIKERKPPFRIVFDTEKSFARAYDIVKMPSSYVYDRRGQLRKEYVGFDYSDVSELEPFIESLLKEDVK